MLAQILSLLVVIPILGLIGCLLVPKRWERTIFSIATATVSSELGALLLLSCKWLSSSNLSPITANVGTLFARQDYIFSLNFYFDKISLIFLGMTTISALLIFIFSKYYMHREQGFKRFYSTVLLFLTGLTFIILSGNLEVLFVGWEIIGISSVLLIAFYRDRFLPARNALKVFSIYRIADAFLLAAVLYAHHIFEKNIQFSEFSTLIAQHGNHIVVFGTLVFVAALIKSAQFPFSYWLPRAMEGPTTSSAIFYGALSVHMGLFLLLRTYPLWEGSMWLRLTIGALGLVTALVATSIARAQSSAKAQIAYASVSQIGLMFIELAAGLKWLALFHFISNASLRTYQLLISPSTVSYLVHDQFFYFVPPVHKIKNTLLGKLHATIYVLSVNEWNMNSAASRYVWQPLKALGRACAFLDKPLAQITCLMLFFGVAGANLLAVLPAGQKPTISIVAAILSLLFYIRAYTTKGAAITAWNLIMGGHLFGILFLGLVSTKSWKYTVLYCGGVVVAYVLGRVCLQFLGRKGQQSDLRGYQGAMYRFTNLGNLFFILTLLFIAFPISPSFLAQDILLSSIPGSHIVQTALFCFSYVLVGVSAMRLYVKVFFGPHRASYHEKAYRSS